MRRAICRVVVLIVFAAISAYVRHQYGGQIGEAVHNFVVNQAMGTHGVDYAGEMRHTAVRFESVEQALKTNPKPAAGDHVTNNAAAAAKAYGAGTMPSAIAPHTTSIPKSATPTRPKNSTSTATRTTNPTRTAMPTGSSTGAQVYESPFDKRSSLYQHRRAQSQGSR